MDKEVRTVANITELILALYDQVPTLKVTGPLANNLYYASRNLRLIGLVIVVLFTALFSALYRPNLMVPVIIICLGLLGLFSLPIIFLFMAQVSLRTLSKVRRNYLVQSFNSGSQELIYTLRSGAPKTAQGERNLRSLRLVLPLHHKFKFRHHHATSESPLSSLETAAAAPEGAVPDTAAAPANAGTDAATEVAAPKAKPKRTTKAKAAAKTTAVAETSAGAKAETTVSTKAENTAGTKAETTAGAKVEAATGMDLAAQSTASAKAPVLTRVISRRKKAKSTETSVAQ